MTYVIKMDGEKVRAFNDRVLARAWAKKHCSGEWVVAPLVERAMPRASSIIYPNEDMPDLRYKPFISLG